MTSKFSGKSRERSRVTIGLAISDTEMHPNSIFKHRYVSEWEKHFGNSDIKEQILYCGLFSLILSIIYKTGLYNILISVYGVASANAILDFSMYSILYNSNVVNHYQECMRNKVIFSNKLYGNHWFSDFFNSVLSENNNYKFKKLWLEKCLSDGVSSVFISIDGTNNDCDSKNSDLTEHGKDKSHTNGDIISYIWVLDANTGLPITYKVNYGSVPDCKSFQEIITYLK